MTDSFGNAVIPYSRFLEYQERRRSMDAELLLRDRPPTIDADVVCGGRNALSFAIRSTLLIRLGITSRMSASSLTPVD